MIYQSICNNKKGIMPLVETFRKDRKHWSHQQVQEVELFFILSPFFGPHYEHQDFQAVVDLTFYHKLQPMQEVQLNLNKKPTAIILLSGHIQYYRHSHHHDRKQSNQKDLQKSKFIKIGQCLTHPELIQIKTDVLIKSPEEVSEFLFIPAILFDAYVSSVKRRRTQTILKVLTEVFRDIPKNELKEMAANKCEFREVRMNTYLFRAGEKAEYCFVVLDGNVRLDSASYEHKKMMQTAIIGVNTLFGHREPQGTERTQNAVCCSSQGKVLQIPLESYLKLLLENKHLNPSYAEQFQKLSEFRAKRSQSQRVTLPRIQRFHSYVRPEQEQKIEKKLVQNCHMLINLSPRKKSNASFRLPQHIDKDYTVSQFQQKLKLFNRRRSSNSRLDLSNKLF